MPPSYTVDFDNYHPCHASDYFIYKKKKYNDQLKDVHIVPPSKLVSSEEFKNIRSSSDGFSLTMAAERGEEADKRNLYTKNLYVSKPFTEINKDFKFQPLVRNAQTSSEDTPYWFQGGAKYYTSENFDLTKKMRKNLNDQPKTDIFGKLNVEYPKTEYMFRVQPPSKGQRYELNKMVVVEKASANDLNPRLPHVKLRWDEDVQKQSYDRSKLECKIGNSQDLHIKKIKAKASFDPKIAYMKIGEADDVTRIKKEKSLDLKIGHPNDEYKYFRKSRDDGFLANRKEIVGERYQKSDFFV